MKTPRLFPTLLLIGVLVPASIAGQEAEERIRSALDRATEAGIPTSLLESKVAEGEAKGIPTDRIAAAVEHRLSGLTRAQEALADVPDTDVDDLAVSADALESGVSEAVLNELATATPPDRRSVAIAALTYLVNAQMAPADALTTVREALERGPAALQNLPARAAGMGPGQAGPPAGIPAPGVPPAGGPPEGAGPPVDPPGGPGGG